MDYQHSVSNTSPKDDKSWDDLEDDGNPNNAFSFRWQVLGPKFQTHSWWCWWTMMCIELHMSSCSATDWGAKKILPRPSPYLAVHRITMQWKITHLSKVHYHASLQALKLSGNRIANISHLPVGHVAITDCKNSRVRRLGVFQWRMCLWSVVKISKQVQKHTWINTRTQLTAKLTPCSNSPSWDADSFLASQKKSAFFGTRRFMTSFKTACHLFLCWERLVQSILPIRFLEDPFCYYSPIYA
jgi:hypothetical protein